MCQTVHSYTHNMAFPLVVLIALSDLLCDEYCRQSDAYSRINHARAVLISFLRNTRFDFAQIGRSAEFPRQPENSWKVVLKIRKSVFSHVRCREGNDLLKFADDKYVTNIVSSIISGIRNAYAIKLHTMRDGGGDFSNGADGWTLSNVT